MCLTFLLQESAFQSTWKLHTTVLDVKGILIHYHQHVDGCHLQVETYSIGKTWEENFTLFSKFWEVQWSSSLSTQVATSINIFFFFSPPPPLLDLDDNVDEGVKNIIWVNDMSLEYIYIYKGKFWIYKFGLHMRILEVVKFID